MKVYAVEDGQARLAFDDAGIEVTYPPDAGVVGGGVRLNPEQTYTGLVGQIVTEVSRRFLSLPAEE